jgi:hypothetical protein
MKMKTRLGFAMLCALLAAGCASIKYRNASVVEARGSVYLPPLVVPASVDSLLAPLGWTQGRFATELAKEIRFQLNHKGVATPQDSAGVTSRLEIQVDHYDPTDYAIKGHLTTPAGARDIVFEKKSGAAEREDPTIDNIRLMAENLAEKARNDPSHRRTNTQAPVLMLIPL